MIPIFDLRPSGRPIPVQAIFGAPVTQPHPLQVEDQENRVSHSTLQIGRSASARNAEKPPFYRVDRRIPDGRKLAELHRPASRFAYSLDRSMACDLGIWRCA
jgi:hypothetical protein